VVTVESVKTVSSRNPHTHWAIINTRYEGTTLGEQTPCRLLSIRLPASHPFPAEITIGTIDLNNLCRFAERSAEMNVIGHDEPTGNKVTVYVACVCDEVRQILLHSWG
jgi:hypothetical protein